jgi:predicted phosphodiesterase
MPAAILSDIHGNTPAFEAVLADIERCGCSTILILGDIINGFDPAGSLALVRGLGERAITIKGNAEHYTLTPRLEELPGRDTSYHPSLIRLITFFRDRLTPGDLAWLEALPDHRMWQGACLVHDSPLDRFYPARWRIPGLADIYQEWYFHARGITDRMPEEDWQELWAWMEAQDVWGVFCGHTHEPFIRRSDTRLVCNAGGAGFPLDGDPRPSWVLLEGQPGSGCALTIRRVNYDIERAVQMIDDEPDFHDWDTPAHRAAYKKMIQTGIHWRAHEAKE